MRKRHFADVAASIGPLDKSCSHNGLCNSAPQFDREADVVEIAGNRILAPINEPFVHKQTGAEIVEARGHAADRSAGKTSGRS